MAPLKLALILVLASVPASRCAHREAPAPAVDCSSLVLTMADCLSFVSNGSTVDKPEGTCCSGLKTVLKTDAECLCEAFRSSAQLGVVLNVSKAMTLPTACKVSATSATKCAMSITPAAAPVLAPTSSPSIAAAPTAPESANEVAPAPAPGNSAASSTTVISLLSSAVAIAAWFLL